MCPYAACHWGRARRVGLVGALAHEPDVVILDEPTNGLDPLAVVGFRICCGR